MSSSSLLRVCSAALLSFTFGVSLSAQVVVGPGTPLPPQPLIEPGCGLAKTFVAIGEQLISPQTGRANAANFSAWYAARYQAASDLVFVAQGQLASIATAEPAHASELQATIDALDMVRIGFAGIAADFDDTDITSSLSYWAVADGLTQFSGVLASLHPDLADSAVVAMEVANSYATMSNALTAATTASVIEFFGEFLHTGDGMAALGHELELDAPVSMPVAALPCPPGSYSDCETNTWKTAGSWSCGAWVRFASGPSVAGVNFCPDGGLWRRTCSRTVTEWSQTICCCYESRFERFFGINGFNVTASTPTATGSSTETTIENTWSCFGAP